MIGAGIRSALAAVLLASGASGPALGSVSNGWRPVPSTREAPSIKGDRPPKRRDSVRQAAAQAKRERKNEKRRRDWLRCHAANMALPIGAVFARVIHHGK